MAGDDVERQIRAASNAELLARLVEWVPVDEAEARALREEAGRRVRRILGRGE